MRILFVGSNRGGGGTESHFISLARSLADAGHEVFAAVRPDDFIQRGLALDPRITLFDVEFRSRRDLHAIHRISKLARTLRPDWIVGAFKAEYWGLAVAAKTAGVPLALFSHLDQRIRPLLVSRFGRLVRGVIVPSQYLRGRTVARGIPEKRIAVLPNPIDVDHFRPHAPLRAETRRALGLRDGDVLIGYVGRFEPAKGVATLARALNSVMRDRPQVHALWVGHGKSEQALRELVRDGDNAARHHWLPWIDDVHPAYTAMDLLALPSEGSESFGRVLVEAQACGVPVVGARNGGIPEALADGHTGRLVAPGDIGEWSAALTSLVEDDLERARLAQAARNFATQFDARHIAAALPRILSSFDDEGETVAAPLPVRLAQKAVGD